MQELVGQYKVRVRETASGYGAWLEDRLVAEGETYEEALAEAESILLGRKTGHLEDLVKDRKRP